MEIGTVRPFLPVIAPLSAAMICARTPGLLTIMSRIRLRAATGSLALIASLLAVASSLLTVEKPLWLKPPGPVLAICAWVITVSASIRYGLSFTHMTFSQWRSSMPARNANTSVS